MTLRFVHVEWDGGRESFDAILRAESADGAIVSEIHDLVPRRGWKWISSDALASAVPLDDNSPVVRLAGIRSMMPETIDVGLTTLAKLLDHLASTAELVGVFQASTGSDKLEVGRVERRAESEFVLDLVNPSGEWEHDKAEYEMGVVISVEWRTDYLLALSDLAGPR